MADRISQQYIEVVADLTKVRQEVTALRQELEKPVSIPVSLNRGGTGHTSTFGIPGSGEAPPVGTPSRVTTAATPISIPDQVQRQKALGTLTVTGPSVAMQNGMTGLSSGGLSASTGGIPPTEAARQQGIIAGKAIAKELGTTIPGNVLKQSGRIRRRDDGSDIDFEENVLDFLPTYRKEAATQTKDNLIAGVKGFEQRGISGATQSASYIAYIDELKRRGMSPSGKRIDSLFDERVEQSMPWARQKARTSPDWALTHAVENMTPTSPLKQAMIQASEEEAKRRGISRFYTPKQTSPVAESPSFNPAPVRNPYSYQDDQRIIRSVMDGSAGNQDPTRAFRGFLYAAQAAGLGNRLLSGFNAYASGLNTPTGDYMTRPAQNAIAYREFAQGVAGSVPVTGSLVYQISQYRSGLRNQRETGKFVTHDEQVNQSLLLARADEAVMRYSLGQSGRIEQLKTFSQYDARDARRRAETRELMMELTKGEYLNDPNLLQSGLNARGTFYKNKREEEIREQYNRTSLEIAYDLRMRQAKFESVEQITAGNPLAAGKKITDARRRIAESSLGSGVEFDMEIAAIAADEQKNVVDELRRNIKSYSGNRSSRALLRNDILGGRLEQITGEFREATAGMETNSPEYIRNGLNYRNAMALARKQFSDQTMLQGIGLSGSRSSIGFRLGDNPFAASVQGIATAGVSESLSLLLGGRPGQAWTRMGNMAQEVGLAARERGRDIYQTEYGLRSSIKSLERGIAFDPIGAQAFGIAGSAAQEVFGLQRAGVDFSTAVSLARTKGNKELDLLRQNYLLGFRGADLGAAGDILPQGVRDVQDPSAVLAQIEAARAEIDKAKITDSTNSEIPGSIDGLSQVVVAGFNDLKSMFNTIIGN